MRIVSRYFDSLVDPLFANDEQGRRVFYPAGILARGRILPDARREDAVRRRAKLVSGVMFAMIIPMIGVMGGVGFTFKSFSALMCLAVVVGIGQALYFRSLVSDLPVSDTRLKMATAWRTQASSLGRGWLRALFGVSAVFVVLGLAIAVFDRTMLLVGLASVAMFGVCAIVFWRQLRMLDQSAERTQTR